MHQGNIFIISAASGTGKTTLVSRLLNHHADLRVSVSHTTRPMRQGEENGKHYHFVAVEQFETLIAQQAFLEHANVFGNYYGTSIDGVRQLQSQGFDVILEIDVQGAAQVKAKLPDAVSIFILPPSLTILEARLRGRATDTDEVIARRLNEAKSEIQQAFQFDYAVVNEDLEQAEADLVHIIQSCRLQQKQQRLFIEQLLNH